jgi:hypothetical protein
LLVALDIHLVKVKIVHSELIVVRAHFLDAFHSLLVGRLFDLLELALKSDHLTLDLEVLFFLQQMAASVVIRQLLIAISQEFFEMLGFLGVVQRNGFQGSLIR